MGCGKAGNRSRWSTIRSRFLDEPYLGLITGQRELLSLVQSGARGGNGVILCSHMLTEVERLRHGSS
jgi:ABC-type multidrug transport system ATPase subunit